MRCCSSAGTVAVLGAGATFLDSLSDYTPDQMADSLEQLATLHAATWMGAVAQAEWLSPRLESYTIARGATEIAGNFDGPIGAAVPAAVRDSERLFGTYKVVGADAA